MLCRTPPAALLAAPLAAFALVACNPAGPPPPQQPSATAADAGADLELGQLDGKDPKQLLAMVDKLGGKLAGRPKSFEILAALGNLYYENGRYLDAVDAYRQALQLSAPLEAKAAALRARGASLSGDLPLECRRSGPGYGLSEIAKVVEKDEAADPGRALRCAREALGMAVAARARRGNALYLVGNPDDALAEHRRVLEMEPDHPESLFFVGAILLEKSRVQRPLREEGKKMWERLVAVAPDHPRGQIAKENLTKIDQLFAPPDAGPARATASAMPPGHPSLGDQGALPSGHPPLAPSGVPAAGAAPGAEGGPTPEQVRNVAEAVANADRSPELEKSFDEAIVKGEKLLDQGNFAEARSALLPAMPMRPNDPKLAAALGGAMRGLGKLPMAERVLSRALELDPKSPRANYELGLLLAAKGDKAGARARLEAARAADAGWAGQHKVAEEIAKLR